jgi:hypothetical protein
MSNIISIIRRNRLISTLAATATVLAIAPAGASAATTWFGSSLNHDPANAGSSCADNGLSSSSMCTHVGSYYPGTSGRAKATVTGTIVSIRVRAEGPMTMRVKVVRVRNMASDHRSAQAKAVAKSRLLQAQGPSQTDLDNGIYPIETFPVHLQVQKGQEIAIDTSSNTAEYCSDGTPGQLLFGPVLGVGSQFRNSGGVDDCLMLVQAVVRH